VLADWRRPATEDEREQMQSLIREAMQAGAIGMSSGTFYQTAYAADILELIPLVREVASAGGIYVTHMRTEMEEILAAIDEVALTARHAGAPLVISHHKCAGRLNWGRSRETLAYIDQLHQQQSIHLDVYPYVAGSTMLRLDMIDEETKVLITSSEPHPEMVGKSLASVAAAWQISQREAAQRLIPGGACYFQMHEDDVVRIMQHPRAMIGSDGIPHDTKPHPRLWGTFPRVLGEYVRHRRALSLEVAVHKMTGLSANTFKLGNRGLIRPGMAGDLTIFDPDSIEDLADFQEPTRVSKGIEAVYVAGELTYDLYGRVLNRCGRFIARSMPTN
jgi:N-acyl-D-amino-acid deacylase